MSRLEKEIERLKSKPKDYTFDEAKSLLNKLGFFEYNKGKTSGSRVEFKDKYGRKMTLHKPHPSNIIKIYKVNDLLNELKEWGLIK